MYSKHWCANVSDILTNVWVLGFRLRIVRLSGLEASDDFYPLTSSEHFSIEKHVSIPVIFLLFVCLSTIIPWLILYCCHQWWCEWGGSFLVLSVDILNAFWMNLEDHFIPRLRKLSVLVLLIILFMSEVLPIVPWVISLTFYLCPWDLVWFVFINVQMFIFIYFIFCL